jgi:Na+-transporting methylmalonyl-CoA/oxaloacetate decarboxylase gamma subunit
METLGTGLNFMLVGMGGVFLFLLVLVFAMAVMHRVLGLFGGSPGQSAIPARGGDDGEEDRRRRAAAAAAAYHRSRGRKP